MLLANVEGPYAMAAGAVATSHPCRQPSTPLEAHAGTENVMLGLLNTVLVSKALRASSQEACTRIVVKTN
jgi:hypothetical protein